MEKKATSKELLQQNPDVDKEQLEKALEAIQAVKDHGIKAKGYGLVPPFHGGMRKGGDDPRAYYSPKRK